MEATQDSFIEKFSNIPENGLFSLALFGKMRGLTYGMENFNEDLESLVYRGQTEDISRNPESLMLTGKKQYACTYCDFSTAHKGALRTHHRTHTGEKPFGCTMCDYRSAYKASLRDHLRTHTGEKPFKCPYCDYSSTQRPNLKKHMVKHTGEKPFQCNECDYKAAFMADLRVHKRTHTGEKPFSCPKCDYKCAQVGALRLHERTHNADKPFECTDCDYKAKYKSHIKKHMETHYIDQPFKCPQCDFRYGESKELLTHMIIHTNENSPSELHSDIVTYKENEVNQNEPFKCYRCDFRTPVKEALVVHMRTHFHTFVNLIAAIANNSVDYKSLIDLSNILGNENALSDKEDNSVQDKFDISFSEDKLSMVDYGKSQIPHNIFVEDQILEKEVSQSEIDLITEKNQINRNTSVGEISISLVDDTNEMISSENS
ncbi:unnamed protein product [Meganyctiphanes norvegica]|uniref:C2H2-type domain-containing protein n=1 Tax=Meganyctiphanes norvegica TaxID=48144 RepID=A0AAV2QXU3_MEGNR